jgi:hypothetical protein
MSALPPKADMCSATRDIRYGSKADSCTTVNSVSIQSPHHSSTSSVRASNRAALKGPRTDCCEIFVVSVLLFSAAQLAASSSLTFRSLKARKIYHEFMPRARNTRVVRCEKQGRTCHVEETTINKRGRCRAVLRGRRCSGAE